MLLLGLATALSSACIAIAGHITFLGLISPHVEVVTALFLQPFLRLGLASLGISIVSPTAVDSVRGSGALIVGANELFCDGLGTVGARSSVKFETAAGDRRRALRLLYWTTAVCIVIDALCALNVSSWFWVGLVVIGLITMLQNLRRPIYVSALNDVANRPLRATILSIDNQATALGTAALMPVMGFIADRWGLWTICALSASLFLLGFVSRQRGFETNGPLSSNP